MRVGAQRHDACDAVHAALCAVMAWLALALSVPGGTFDAAPYRMMAAVGSEHAWAMAFWAAASAGVAGLATPSRPLRLACVLGLATMHGVVALCFAVSDPSATGAGPYAVLAGLGYHLAWRQSDEET